MKKFTLLLLFILICGLAIFYYRQQTKRKPAGPKPRKEIPILTDELLLAEESTLTTKERIGHILRYYIAVDDSVDMLLEHMDRSTNAIEKKLQAVGDSKGIAGIVEYYILKNLTEKRTSGKEALPMQYDELKRLVIEYECFKMDRYVTSGVFPKRYFGYFDGKYDTAPLEKRMCAVIPRIVSVINQYQKEVGDSLCITDIEVAVTFIAEGGAILLRERQDLLTKLHPVFEVGLDDIASGSAELQLLQSRIDSVAGTDLVNLVGWVQNKKSARTHVPDDRRWLQHKNGTKGPHAYLTRYMSFEEAIAGTALMYIWEKRIAQRKMRKIGVPSLHTYSLEQQFIISSLVYNSGILHSPERWRMVEKFATGEWIHATSERNAKRRWRLNVHPPKVSLQSLRDGYDYLEQPTEWLAVYHIMQRYGAFVALQKFSDYFTEKGAFSTREKE